MPNYTDVTNGSKKVEVNNCFLQVKKNSNPTIGSKTLHFEGYLAKKSLFLHNKYGAGYII